MPDLMLSASAPPKLLSPRRTRLRLSVAAAAVLAIGSLTAPTPRSTDVPALEERPTPLLEAQVARAQPAPEPFEGVHDVAARVIRHCAAIALPGDQLGAAVFISDGHVVAPEAVVDGRDGLPVMVGGSARTARVVAYDAASGLALLRVAGPTGPPAVMASDAPRPGQLLVASAYRGGREAVWPAFAVSVDAATLLLSPAPPVAGAPVFTRNGALVGVTDGEGGRVVRTTGPLVDRLLAGAPAGDLPLSVGIELQRLDQTLSRRLGDAGVLVADVVPGGPADRAGIRPGDVLTTLGGSAIGAGEDVAGRLAGLRTSEVGLRRGGRAAGATIDAVPAHHVAALARRARATEESVNPDVLPGALRRAAALAPGDRLLSVEDIDRPTAAAVQRLLRTARLPLLLRIRTTDGRVEFRTAEVPR